MLEIYVDGDACPVKSEVLRVADRHSLVVHMVSNGGLRPSGNPRVRQVVVSQGADAADDWIAEHIGPGDIAVTADIPLASRCLEKGARVIGNSGKPFTDDNIGMSLAMRGLMSDLRDAGQIKGHNPNFTKQDRSRFLQELDKAVNSIRRR